MKIAALFATVALAQDMGDGRAMSLQKKIDNAGKKCSVYMEKAMVCDPPAGKIGKYNYRLEKVSRISVSFALLWPGIPFLSSVKLNKLQK